MSAPPATCSGTSTSSCERSSGLELRLERLAAGRVDPLADDAERLLRPDDDGPRPRPEDGVHSPPSPLASGLPSRSAEPRDAGLAAEADQVQAGDAGQLERALGDLDRDLEARRLGIGGPLDALDRLGRDRDPRHLLVHVAERRRRPDEADRGQDRRLLGEPALDGRVHETLELRVLEADLELEEARAGAGPSSAPGRRGTRTAARRRSRPRRGRAAAPARSGGRRGSGRPRARSAVSSSWSCRGRRRASPRARRPRSRRRRSGRGCSRSRAARRRRCPPGARAGCGRGRRAA